MPTTYTWAALPGLLALAGAARAQPAAFGPATNFDTSSYTSNVAVADVNGDGYPDFLSTTVDDVALRLGTGTGSFGAATTFNPGLSTMPVGLAVADVNQDGRPDVLTANYMGSSASVLLGTGTGSFGAATVLPAGANSHPLSIAVADVNGDGKPDLLTANRSSHTAGVLLGTGNGNFAAVTTFSTGAGSEPFAIAVADVNGDGRPDLLTANKGTSTVGVLLGTGTGTFGTVTTYSASAGSAPRGIAVADVNGDGRPDLLTANNDSNSAGVLLNAGGGIFGAVTTYSAAPGGHPTGLAVADVNGDGRPDLLLASGGTDAAGVLLGTGPGSFGAATAFSLGVNSSSTAIAAADVNGDARPDLLIANYNSSTVAVLLNAGTYTPLGAATTLAAAATLPAEALALYPNPAHGRLQVAVDRLGACPVRATLLDALGRVVRQQAVLGPAFTLDTEGLPAGVYTLHLQAGAATVARRVVLQ